MTHDVEDAIQRFVDLIYEMGLDPDTVREVKAVVGERLEAWVEELESELEEPGAWPPSR